MIRLRGESSVESGRRSNLSTCVKKEANATLMSLAGKFVVGRLGGFFWNFPPLLFGKNMIQF